MKNWEKVIGFLDNRLREILRITTTIYAIGNQVVKKQS